MILKLIIAFLIGAGIGLERESPQDPKKQGDQPEDHGVGLRTFSLIALLGALAGTMIRDYFSIFLILSILVTALILAYYVLHSLISKDAGITTEIALLYSYLIGLMIGDDILPIQLIIAIAVVLILVLSRKEDIRHLVFGISRREINAFVSYALIALVILPFLPHIDYTLADIPNAVAFLKRVGWDPQKFADITLLNPFKLWFIVAVITGIDVAGYFLERLVGKGQGRLMSSFAGGFISSTATTQALAHESKSTKATTQIVASAVYANMISFVPLFFLIGSTNFRFLLESTPTLLTLLVSAGVVGTFFYLIRTHKQSVTHIHESHTKRSIFDLKAAVTFVIIFAVIRIISEAARALFGSSGVFITTAIAAFTGVDAAILTLSQMAGNGISYTDAVWGLVLINGVNLGAKSFYSFLQGSRGFAIRFAAAMAIVIICSIIGTLIFH